MLRVLQLLSTESDFQTTRLVETIEKGFSSPDVVARNTIGVGGSYRNILHAHLLLKRERFDLIHAWDAKSLTAAVLSGTTPIVFSSPATPDRVAAKWIRAVIPHRPLQLTCATATEWRQWVRLGVPPERCHLLRPPVDFGRLRGRTGSARREKLGLNPDDFVLMAAGESNRLALHEYAVWALSMVHLLDSRYRLLLWGRGPLLGRVKRLARSLDASAMLRIAEQKGEPPLEYEEALLAADAVISCAERSTSPLPLSISMAAGRPIVATATSSTSELLEDRHTALLVRPGSARAMAQRIMELREDVAMQRRIADAARGEAYRFFSQARWLEDLRKLYQQHAQGRLIMLDEPAASR